ncbi:MAG TPA: hypothetical protein VHH73_19065, partial [Verrucomicrobiae bacterium]|nr:hypothetical protein [Verrucomicrobiae bacterium]
DSGLVSDVRAGENEGRQLHHDFVVLRMAQSTLRNSGNTWTGEFTLTTPGKANGQAALAVWVTNDGDLTPLQAVGGWLAKAQSPR